LRAMDPARFAERADRLGIVAVVMLEDDVPQLGWLPERTAFRRRIALAPFAIFAREIGVTLPVRDEGGAWRITLTGEAHTWVPVRMAYYPLWRATSGEERLERRRGDDGILEVRLTQAAQTVTLSYRAGPPEILGLAITLASLVAWAARLWRSR
jgi:hypothetical protein